MGYKKSACLKTIAYELKLSINTVSRALRDCDDISEKTKKIVRQKAIEMGYLPNSVLYSMKSSDSHLIGIIINNIQNFYFSIMNSKLTYYLKKEGYLGVIIPLFGNEFNVDVVKECIYQRVDGIISFVEPTKESLDVVKINKIPLLIVGRHIDDDYCDEIYTDDYHGGELAAEYLSKYGVKNYIYVGINGSECAERRYSGFKDYIRDKLKTNKYKKVMIECFEKYIPFIKENKNIGIFCYNDEHYYLVKSILEKHNVNIDEIKFIGYDAINANLEGTVYIPSIGFDYDAIAKAAVSSMISSEKDQCKGHLSLCYNVRLEDKKDRGNN